MSARRKKIYLFLGAVAAWIFALSDKLMDMQGMFDERFYRPFLGMSRGVALYGSLSMLAFPCLALGLALILRAARLHVLVPLTLFYLLTVPMVIHTSFIYYYDVVNAPGSESWGPELLHHFDGYKNVFGAVYFLGLILISFCLFVQILRGRSLFPRSFAALNPLVGLGLLMLMRALVPSWAAVLYPFFVPASFLAYFVTACAIYLWAKPHRLEELGPATLI